MQKRKTKAQKAAELAEQKKALGALDGLHAHYITLVPTFNTQYANEIYDAIQILARSIHGEPTGKQKRHLCHICHEAYATYWVELQEILFGTYHRTCGCCTPCKDKLLAEGKLFTVDDQRVAPPPAGEEGVQA